MKKLLAVCAVLLCFGGTASADLISEFEPNPPGQDPSTTQIELSGTAGASFSGFLTFIDTDGGATGDINSNDAVSGTYDANGLATITLNFDAENPSYVLVFSENGADTDVDANNDDILDDPSVFGDVYDAIGIIDSTSDATDYATVLGGVEFSTADEFEIAFRDGSTGQFFGYDAASGNIFDTAGNIFTAGDFVGDPTVTSYGGVNASLAAVPEPSSVMLVGLAFAGLGFRRRRS